MLGKGLENRDRGFPARGDRVGGLPADLKLGVVTMAVDSLACRWQVERPRLVETSLARGGKFADELALVAAVAWVASEALIIRVSERESPGSKATEAARSAAR